MNTLFPELMSGLLKVANRLLPRPNGAGAETRPGREHEPLLAASLLTALTDRAAEQNNE
jgi:hypothetical protein